jgi:transposase
MLAEGRRYGEVEQSLGCSSPYVTRWKRRFLENRMRGLDSRYVGGRPRVRTAALEAKILEKTRSQPADGSTHWSTRKLGAELIGLYLNPPRHAAIFCLDEKSHIQALDRLDPVLPLSPGRAERHGFEYYRHGTLSLYAALDTRSGAVLGKPVTRHTSQELIGFLQEVIASQPKGKEIHVILDNLSAHKSAVVREFLDRHPRVQFHFTPTYSSWLNQVEIWFAKIEREVIARGVFTSVGDLARKLMRYIRHYNKRAKPIRWTYRDTSRRITYDSAVTGH